VGTRGTGQGTAPGWTGHQAVRSRGVRCSPPDGQDPRLRELRTRPFRFWDVLTGRQSSKLNDAGAGIVNRPVPYAPPTGKALATGSDKILVLRRPMGKAGFPVPTTNGRSIYLWETVTGKEPAALGSSSRRPRSRLPSRSDGKATSLGPAPPGRADRKRTSPPTITGSGYPGDPGDGQEIDPGCAGQCRDVARRPSSSPPTGKSPRPPAGLDKGQGSLDQPLWDAFYGEEKPLTGRGAAFGV